MSRATVRPGPRIYARPDGSADRVGCRAAGLLLPTESPVTRPVCSAGLWFNASEVYALLTMDHLLSSLQPGLLEPIFSLCASALGGFGQR
ncbi:MAG: hypothetical protein Ct9H300mP14_12890 [Gammaproteobacteria bacterium]|nr:MAG: hypothetical protein Ct9H300mP14_12890 [Gammaproteobacteria bacterium]